MEMEPRHGTTPALRIFSAPCNNAKEVELRDEPCGLDCGMEVLALEDLEVLLQELTLLRMRKISHSETTNCRGLCACLKG